MVVLMVVLMVLILWLVRAWVSESVDASDLMKLTFVLSLPSLSLLSPLAPTSPWTAHSSSVL